MKTVALATTGLVLAGCAVPTYYTPMPTPISIAPQPLVTPYTAPRPYYDPPPPPALPTEPPPPEPGTANPATPDPSAYETPPVLLQPLPDTVETPQPQPPVTAAPPPPPPQPDPGGAVPMMGFRPMKGQKATAP